MKRQDEENSEPGLLRHYSDKASFVKVPMGIFYWSIGLSEPLLDYCTTVTAHLLSIFAELLSTTFANFALYKHG